MLKFLSSAVVAMSCLFAPLANAAIFNYTSKDGYLTGTADVAYEEGVDQTYFLGEELLSFSFNFYYKDSIKTWKASISSDTCRYDCDELFMTINGDGQVTDWNLRGSVSGIDLITCTECSFGNWLEVVVFDDGDDLQNFGSSGPGAWSKVPEPSSLALVGLAAVALGWSQRRRRIGAGALAQ